MLWSTAVISCSAPHPLARPGLCALCKESNTMGGTIFIILPYLYHTHTHIPYIKHDIVLLRACARTLDIRYLHHNMSAISDLFEKWWQISISPMIKSRKLRRICKQDASAQLLKCGGGEHDQRKLDGARRCERARTTLPHIRIVRVHRRTLACSTRTCCKSTLLVPGNPIYMKYPSVFRTKLRRSNKKTQLHQRKACMLEMFAHACIKWQTRLDTMIRLVAPAAPNNKGVKPTVKSNSNL